MREVYNIIQQLVNTSGRNDKEEILFKNKDNQLLKKILHFVYDPYTLTGISGKKMNKKLKNKAIISLNEIEQIMDYLSLYNSGRDIDIAIVQEFVQSQPEDIQDLYKQIFTKELKIGATDGTLNKIYGKGFINSFDVMLAEKYSDNEDKIKGEFIVTKKLDGNRNIAINDTVVKLFTRQGKPNEGFYDVEIELALLPKGYAYDGEFIASIDNDLSSADLYRETTSKVRKDGVKTDVIFHVFDMIPISDFRNGICNIPCIERKQLLHDTLSNLNLKWIKEVPMLYVGEDKNIVIKLLNQMIEAKEEGVMVNIANAPYENRRTKNILKVKMMKTCDLEIIGFEEGEGRLKGTLGRINVLYKGNEVGVGSGLSDLDRSFLWGNQNDLIGKIVEIQYFEESKNAKTGEFSLRFPVFIKLRSDKEEESLY